MVVGAPWYPRDEAAAARVCAMSLPRSKSNSLSLSLSRPASLRALCLSIFHKDPVPNSGRVRRELLLLSRQSPCSLRKTAPQQLHAKMPVLGLLLLFHGRGWRRLLLSASFARREEIKQLSSGCPACTLNG